MDALERLRHALGAPMILRSAYRSHAHRREVRLRVDGLRGLAAECIERPERAA